MNPDLVNLYIERLLNEVGELVKTKLLIETQLKYTEIMNSKLTQENEKLVAQLEKLNKKKTKEVDTSENF